MISSGAGEQRHAPKAPDEPTWSARIAVCGLHCRPNRKSIGEHLAQRSGWSRTAPRRRCRSWSARRRRSRRSAATLTIALDRVAGAEVAARCAASARTYAEAAEHERRPPTAGEDQLTRVWAVRRRPRRPTADSWRAPGRRGRPRRSDRCRGARAPRLSSSVGWRSARKRRQGTLRRSTVRATGTQMTKSDEHRQDDGRARRRRRDRWEASAARYRSRRNAWRTAPADHEAEGDGEDCQDRR